MEALDPESEKTDPNLFDSGYSSPQNDAVLKIFMICGITAAMLISLWVLARYNLNDLNILFGRGGTPPRIDFTPQQAIVPTRNPFRLVVDDTTLNDDTYTITCLLTTEERCIIRAYWGTDIKEAYPRIYQEWQEYCGNFSTGSFLEANSFQTGQDIVKEPHTTVPLKLTCPSSMNLGSPPRAKYPLVVVLMDANFMDMTVGVQQVASVVSIFHLKDTACPAKSHIISQFVRTPHGQPYDLKRLFVSNEDSEATPVESPASETLGVGSNHPPTVDSSEPTNSPSSTPTAECTVCLSAPVQVVILPCRHACVCRGCFPRLTNCPLCRYYIISYFNLTHPDGNEQQDEDWEIADWDS